MMAILHRAYSVSIPTLGALLKRFGGLPSEDQCRAFLRAGGLLTRDLKIDLAIDDESDWDDEESRMVVLGMASNRVPGLSERFEHGWQVLDSGLRESKDNRSPMNATLRGLPFADVGEIRSVVGPIRRARFLSHETARQQLDVLATKDPADVVLRLRDTQYGDALFKAAVGAYVFRDELEFVKTVLADAKQLLECVKSDQFLIIFLD